MPVIIEANYQKRLGLPGYSSHSYAVTIRTELSDLGQVERESAKMYALLQGSVDREIVESGFIPEQNSPASVSQNSNQQDAPRELWACTDKQRELILKIREEYKLKQEDIEIISKQLFQRPAKTLNKLEASVLIKELLEEYGPKQTPRGRYQRNGR